VARRKSLRTAGPALQLFARRTRWALLTRRFVSLADRSLALSLDPPGPATLASLVGLGTERAASILATLEDNRRDAILAALDAAARGAALALQRPSVAAVELLQYALAARARIVDTLPAVHAAATLRAMAALEAGEAAATLGACGREMRLRVGALLGEEAGLLCGVSAV